MERSDVLPSRIGVVQDVPSGAIHIAENKFAIGGVEEDQELVPLETDGPSKRQSSHNQILKFLHIVSRGIVGIIDDFVQKEQSRIVPVRKMGPNLRRARRCIGFRSIWIIDLLSVEVVTGYQATRGSKKTGKDGNQVVGQSGEVNGNGVEQDDPRPWHEEKSIDPGFL